MTVPTNDDLEARLAAALNAGLSPVIADAAALRTHARAGSRRIRVRRRVAAGVLSVAVLGGVGALVLPRADNDPRPLPIATPSVTNTGRTEQPTSTASPTSTSSLSLSPTPSGTASTTRPQSTASTPPSVSTGTAGGDPDGAPTRGGAPTGGQATQGGRPATRPATTAGNGLPPKSEWGSYGAFIPGSWLGLDTLFPEFNPHPDAVYTRSGPNTPGTWAGSDVPMFIGGPPYCSSWATGMRNVAATFWGWEGPVGGIETTVLQTVTVWESEAAAIDAMDQVGSCGYTPDPVLHTDTERIAIGTQTVNNPETSVARGMRRVGTTVIAIHIAQSSIPAVDKLAALRDMLDTIASQVTSRGTH